MKHLKKRREWTSTRDNKENKVRKRAESGGLSVHGIHRSLGEKRV